MTKPKIIRLPISKQIDINFRNYALYVLESRGIPNWYDGLTNVQRLILMNAPNNFNKTLSLIGMCFNTGYAHGDASLSKAINKLARPFCCAMKLLDGDGFFGSSINNSAAAPRYTKIKINPKFSKILKENSFLESLDENEQWLPLHTNIPVGLLTMCVGIGVGYSSNILPRNIKDIEKYLNGKIKSIKPYFINFNGKISKYQNFDKTWLIEGRIEFNDEKMIAKIFEIPPLMKYSSFLTRLEKLILLYDNKCKIENNSLTDVNLKIKFNGFKNDWQNFKEGLEKLTKILVTENPVFIKKGLVIQYNRVEDYLDDYKYRIVEIELKRAKYFYEKHIDEIEYNKAKKLYLEFMLQKKRKEDEINIFLKKFNKNISNKLENILLKHLNVEELKRTLEKIKEIENKKKSQNKLIKEIEKRFNKMEDTSISRGVKNKGSRDLFDDLESINGIEFFKGEEDINIPEYDKETEIE